MFNAVPVRMNSANTLLRSVPESSSTMPKVVEQRGLRTIVDTARYVRRELISHPLGRRRLRVREGCAARTEKLVRSFALGSPFVALSLLTKWEVHGRKHIEAALQMSDQKDMGVVFMPRHVTFFDDPFIYLGIGNMLLFTVETKFWWSTASRKNFYPAGSDFKSRFTRYFSDVSNMIYFSRAKERRGMGPKIYKEPHDYLAPRLGRRGMDRLSAVAQAHGMSTRTYLVHLLTQDANGGICDHGAINQIGVIEAIARVQAGEKLNLFPEGTRSRRREGMERKRTPGTGKIGYFADNAIFVPIYFEGMRHILPIGSQVPRPFRRVVVEIGRPIYPQALDVFRTMEPTRDTFVSVADYLMREINALRPSVLERYYGREQAEQIMKEDSTA